MDSLPYKLLVVDDNVDMLETLRHLFTFYGYEVVLASNGREAIEMAEKEHPHLIVLDALMPIMNGFEACDALKRNPKTINIPVIFLSANYTEEEHRIKGFELGADDYILKPFNAKELVARVESILSKKRLIEELRNSNKKLIEEHDIVHKEILELKKKTDQLEDKQIFDSITGVYHEQLFKFRLEEEFYRSKRYENALSLLFFSIDSHNELSKNFKEKAINYILIQVANLILNNTRKSDIIFRLNHSKFGVILNNTSKEGAALEAERISDYISNVNLMDNDFFKSDDLFKKNRQENLQISLSYGIGLLHNNMENAHDLVIETEFNLREYQRSNIKPQPPNIRA
jgi:diguanylate cyclase (GGDEF)-like protein